ncbi:hypothetical protein AAG570_011835 [Ranatra chinensis]|uniref:Uncharacterized protein n=1 Tax=Ranatra chinensis TaxID=642074 RepID=A0ABD0Z5D8_9HEMI
MLPHRRKEIFATRNSVPTRAPDPPLSQSNTLGTPEAAETYGSIEEGAKRRYWSAPSRSKVPPQSQTDSGQPPVQTVEDSNPVLEQDTFHIYCTTIKNDVPKLMGTRGRVRVHRVERVDKSTLDSVLWQCATVVYDISSQSDQLMEAEFVIRSLMDKLTDLEESGKLPLVSLRRFILVSSVMTWALTPPIVTEGTNSELIEEHYKKRRPDPSYGHHFRIENMLLDIGDRFKDNMKVLVICSGCVYGHGEHLLDSLFREVWSNKLTEVPVYGTGNNRIPVIYDADLARRSQMGRTDAVDLGVTPPLVCGTTHYPQEFTLESCVRMFDHQSSPSFRMPLQFELHTSRNKVDLFAALPLPTRDTFTKVKGFGLEFMCRG